MGKWPIRWAIFLVWIIVAAVSASAQDAGPFACPGALPSRLVLGQEGRVIPGDANRLRDQPAISGAAVGRIPAGESFAVLDGPICADDYAWWRVDYDGLTGWTAEGTADAYWLEPIIVADIVFSSEQVTNSRIYTVDEYGEHLTNLSDPDLDFSSPAVSPDGAWIAFLGGESGRHFIAVMSPNGSQRRILSEGADHRYYGPAWSPDSTQVAFWLDPDGRDQNNWELHVIQADGGGHRVLTEGALPDSYPRGGPSWSPDGSQIAFPADYGSGSRDLYILQLADDSVRQVVGEEYSVGRVIWSPDGSVIACGVYAEGLEIILVDPDSGEVRHPTGEVHNANEFAWSPDGSRLVFTSERAGQTEFNAKNVEIFTVKADGSDLRQLTENEAYESCPSWSLDGTRIAFISDIDATPGDDFAGEVYLMDADGQNARRLTENARRDVCPVWIP